MAGFPIRKSPDHSLFIDSPRHIADYNVLHRFLVPRHPPCALKNLKITDTRCSRPLCNSQTTRHTPTNPPQPHRTLTGPHVQSFVAGPSVPAKPQNTHDACPENPTTRQSHPPPHLGQPVPHTHSDHSREGVLVARVVLELARASSACTMIIVPPSTLPSHTR